MLTSAPADDLATPPGGCACNGSGSPAPVGPVALLALGAIARRRRRRLARAS
jgi:MYXO-CTERM domain-containing protein